MTIRLLSYASVKAHTSAPLSIGMQYKRGYLFLFTKKK